MVSPTHSLHKISVHWGAKFYSESGLVDKRPFFLGASRIFSIGKSARLMREITDCTIYPPKCKHCVVEILEIFIINRNRQFIFM